MAARRASASPGAHSNRLSTELPLGPTGGHDGDLAVPVPFHLPAPSRGIAGFTRDLIHSISATARSGGEDVARADVAGIEPGPAEIYRDDQRVAFTVNPKRPGEFARLAAQVNKSPYDAVCVQHDFNLYPGEAGGDLLDFYSACRKPIVTTLHSVPRCPRRPCGGSSAPSPRPVAPPW